MQIGVDWGMSVVNGLGRQRYLWFPEGKDVCHRTPPWAFHLLCTMTCCQGACLHWFFMPRGSEVGRGWSPVVIGKEPGWIFPWLHSVLLESELRECAALYRPSLQTQPYWPITGYACSYLPDDFHPSFPPSFYSLHLLKPTSRLLLHEEVHAPVLMDPLPHRNPAPSLALHLAWIWPIIGP